MEILNAPWNGVGMESVYGQRSGGYLGSGVMPGVLHLRWVVEDGREPERFTVPEEECPRRQRRQPRPTPRSPLPPQGRSRCQSRSPRSRRGGSSPTEVPRGWLPKMPSAPGKASFRRSRSVMLPQQTSPGEEVLDLRPPPGGEVIDDDDVVVLC